MIKKKKKFKFNPRNISSNKEKKYVILMMIIHLTQIIYLKKII